MDGFKEIPERLGTNWMLLKETCAPSLITCPVDEGGGIVTLYSDIAGSRIEQEETYVPDFYDKNKKGASHRHYWFGSQLTLGEQDTHDKRLLVARRSQGLQDKASKESTLRLRGLRHYYPQCKHSHGSLRHRLFTSNLCSSLQEHT